MLLLNVYFCRDGTYILIDIVWLWAVAMSGKAAVCDMVDIL